MNRNHWHSLIQDLFMKPIKRSLFHTWKFFTFFEIRNREAIEANPIFFLLVFGGSGKLFIFSSEQNVKNETEKKKIQTNKTECDYHDQIIVGIDESMVEFKVMRAIVSVFFRVGKSRRVRKQFYGLDVRQTESHAIASNVNGKLIFHSMNVACDTPRIRMLCSACVLSLLRVPVVVHASISLLGIL